MPFESPNYTQTPNDLLDEHMANMGEAELKFVLTIVRQTIGFHRKRVRYSISKISRVTGMSRPAITAAAKAAEEHGYVVRIETAPGADSEWELNFQPAKNLYTPCKESEQVTSTLKKVIKKNADAISFEPKTIEEAIYSGKPVTQEMFKSDPHFDRILDAGRMIDQGMGIIRDMAVAFMETHGNILPAQGKNGFDVKDINKWRKAFKEMRANQPNPVGVDDVIEATKKLMASKDIVISSPMSIVKTAKGIANTPKVQTKQYAAYVQPEDDFVPAPEDE